MACSADSAMSTSMSYFSSIRLKITRADFESSTTSALLRAMGASVQTVPDQAASDPGASLFWAIQVRADSTSASSLAVKPSILTPVASAFFLASSALPTACIHTRPRRTLAVNFCCFSSVISQLLEIVQISSGTIHDYGRNEEPLHIFLRRSDCFFQSITVRGQGVRDHRHVLIRFIPVTLLDGFTHAGQRLDSVAGTQSRRIDHVLVPLAPR